jgi:hypothetical protein
LYLVAMLVDPVVTSGNPVCRVVYEDGVGTTVPMSDWVDATASVAFTASAGLTVTDVPAGFGRLGVQFSGALSTDTGTFYVQPTLVRTSVF